MSVPALGPADPDMPSTRPTVNVVVPFAGSHAELEAVCRRLTALQLRPGDSVLVVDNTPGRPREIADLGIPVVYAAERRTPGFARNAGAAHGSAEWLVFLDADTEPSPYLLDRYFEPPPDASVALIGGGVLDEPVPQGASGAARYAYLRAAMSQDSTFRFGKWGFAKTANAAIRRAAFEAVGGFRDNVRTAEDADLSYRLQALGYQIERREQATVTHHNRRTVRSFIVRMALYGSGAAWLNQEYPGSFPARRRPGLLWWAVRTSAQGLVKAALDRDLDTVVWAVFEPLEVIAFEFGRSLPNERPLEPAAWWRALRRVHPPRGAPRL
jgi:GT2 family glycosyltransferase